MKARVSVYGVVPIALCLEPELTLSDMRVYIALSSFQGNHEESYPSGNQLAERSGISLETVSRSVGHLLKMGWIERDQRGQQKTNVYRVLAEVELTELTATSIPGIDRPVNPELTATSIPSIKRNSHLKEDEKRKHKHGEFNNVLLTSSELEKLKTSFPLDWQERIKTMDEGIELKGYKYKSHYLAILKWAERDKTKASPLFDTTPQNVTAMSDRDRRMFELANRR